MDNTWKRERELNKTNGWIEKAMPREGASDLTQLSSLFRKRIVRAMEQNVRLKAVVYTVAIS